MELSVICKALRTDSRVKTVFGKAATVRGCAVSFLLWPRADRAGRRLYPDGDKADDER